MAPDPAQTSCTTDRPPYGRKPVGESVVFPEVGGHSQRARLFHSNPTQSPGMAPVLCDSPVSMKTLTLAPWLPINSSLTSKGSRRAGGSGTGNTRSHGPLQSTGAPRIREPGNGTGSKLFTLEATEPLASSWRAHVNIEECTHDLTACHDRLSEAGTSGSSPDVQVQVHSFSLTNLSSATHPTVTKVTVALSNGLGSFST